MGLLFRGAAQYVRRCFRLRTLCLAMVATAPVAGLAASLNVKYVTVDGKAIDGAVMVLRHANSEAPLAKPIAADMDQINRSFVPHVLIVPTGSSVTFANSDVVSHQVYSFSSTKKFQLPLYKDKIPAPIVFDRPGVVTVGCNIHDQMSAYVFVVDGHYFGRTDKAGAWSLPELAAGDYQIKVWHPRSRDMRPLVDQTISVAAQGANITLREPQPLKLRPVSQVPANWDAY